MPSLPEGRKTHSESRHWPGAWSLNERHRDMEPVMVGLKNDQEHKMKNFSKIMLEKAGVKVAVSQCLPDLIHAWGSHEKDMNKVSKRSISRQVGQLFTMRDLQNCREQFCLSHTDGVRLTPKNDLMPVIFFMFFRTQICNSPWVNLKMMWRIH